MSQSPASPAVRTEPFLVLPENKVAHAAMLAVGGLGWPSEPEPTTFLWGASGTGKSHLARLLVQSFLKRHPDAKTEIMTASQFAAQVAEASARQTLPLFQAATREFDLLVVEDLQTLEGRTETLTQLLHLVNSLTQSGAVVVWTASRAPGSLAGFPPRLVSRLRGGMTVRVRLPGLTSRVELVRFLAQHHRVRVEGEVWEAFARELPANPREMAGMLQRLTAMARQHGRRIDAELIRRYFSSEEERPELKLADVCREVAQEFGVKQADLRSQGRSQKFAFPRQVGMWLSRELLKTSLKQVGDYYGGRDHTTVVHACRRIGERLGGDAGLQAQVERIRQHLRAGE
ncbi:MAG: AAA family ATPase [Planctomycetaceae bacterium]|nr:MAG: AAA family ATPase [Planctomycetaceae bacterium]